MYKIVELLANSDTPCRVQGINTRIVRDENGIFEVMQKKSKYRDGAYTIQLYKGNDESLAVTAFIAGEKT